MIKVRCEYVNFPKKSGTDYFVFTNIEVQGHADHTGYNNNIKVCAGVSACCYGIRRLLDDTQFKVEIAKGYFSVKIIRIRKLKEIDKDGVYALNTLVCQLFEIYKNNPRAFKEFELVDVKERYEDENKQPSKQKPFRQRRKSMGSNPFIQEEYHQEN